MMKLTTLDQQKLSTSHLYIADSTFNMQFTHMTDCASQAAVIMEEPAAAVGSSISDAVQWLAEALPLVFPGATFEAPLGEAGLGCRIVGVDLRKELTRTQAQLLVTAVPRFRVVCMAGQTISHGPDGVTLQRVERLASHFGCVMPHPNNFLRGGKPAQGDGVSRTLPSTGCVCACSGTP